MAFYNQVYWEVPYHTGQKFWVAPSESYTIEGRSYTASDGNDGTDPRRALRTPAQGITNCTAASDDVVVLLPGAHSISASTAVSKSMVHILGLAGNNPIRPKTSITITATDEIFNVTAANVEIANLRIIPITAACALDWSAAATNLWIHNCSFDMATPAANAATVGCGHASATGYTVAPTNVLIENNYFEVTGAQGPAIRMGDAKDFIVRRNKFVAKGGTWALATGQGGVLGWGEYSDNDFHSFKNATITIGIGGTDLTSTLSVAILRNYFSGTVTKPIDDWGATDASIAENYVTGVGGAAGGVLWSSIT